MPHAGDGYMGKKCFRDTFAKHLHIDTSEKPPVRGFSIVSRFDDQFLLQYLGFVQAIH